MKVCACVRNIEADEIICRLPVPVHDRMHASDIPALPVLKFNEFGDFAALLNNSPHNVVYRNLVYPTALHLYEARKFLDHKPEVAEQIRRSDLQWVTVVSGQYDNFKRRDWGRIGLSTVRGLPFDSNAIQSIVVGSVSTCNGF